MGAIMLAELLMLTLSLHVINYPGFTRAEKRWYLFTFTAIFFCAGAEFISVHFDGRAPAFVVPLTLLNVVQFSLSPMLPVFFVGALGMRRQATFAGGFFLLHALAEIISVPFGWIFYYDSAGRYIRGEYYIVYEAFYLFSIVFLIVCLVIVGRRFKRRDLFTIIMVFVVMVAAILPLILFKVYTDYLGIGLCASLCYIYYNDLIQQDIQAELVADQERMSRMQESIISGLANLIESRDLETGEHVARTSGYVNALAKALWDPTKPFDEVEETYYMDVYGKDGPAVHKYLACISAMFNLYPHMKEPGHFKALNVSKEEIGKVLDAFAPTIEAGIQRGGEAKKLLIASCRRFSLR